MNCIKKTKTKIKSNHLKITTSYSTCTTTIQHQQQRQFSTTKTTKKTKVKSTPITPATTTTTTSKLSPPTTTAELTLHKQLSTPPLSTSLSSSSFLSSSSSSSSISTSTSIASIDDSKQYGQSQLLHIFKEQQFEFKQQQLQFNLEQQIKQLQFELQQQKAQSDLQFKQQQIQFDLQLKELQLQYQYSLPQQQQKQHQKSKQSQLQPQQDNSNDEDQLSQLSQQQFDKIQLQFNQLSTTVQQSLQDQSKQFEQFEQKLISIESLLNNGNNQNNNNNPTQLQTCLTTIEQQRIQVSIILEQNRNLMKDQPPPFVIFQIENYPDIQTSCNSWGNDPSINEIVYYLIEAIHPTKLEPLEETIKSSKLYISSKSVLNGEWIQIQGDGAIVDMNDIKEDLQLGDFLKPGDDIYKYDDYQCKECEEHFANLDDDTTTNRYLIKFKWE